MKMSETLHLPLACMTEIVPSAAPFACCLFPIFDVLVAVGGHVGAPLDTHVIIVV